MSMARSMDWKLRRASCLSWELIGLWEGRIGGEPFLEGHRSGKCPFLRGEFVVRLFSYHGSLAQEEAGRAKVWVSNISF